MTNPLPLASDTPPPATLLPSASGKPTFATELAAGSKEPPVPTYVGAGTPVSSGSSSAANPNDIWGLGDLYGKPIFQGTASKPTTANGGQDLLPGHETSVNKYGQTQDLVKQVIALWAQQKAERDKNPNGLTQYEQLQQALWSGGFYGQTSYDGIHVGQWTSQTQSALNAALKSYEQATNNGQIPMTFTEFLLGNQAPTGGPNGPDATKGAGTTPTQVSLTDPAAIRAAAQSAATAALDRGLSEKELDKFVAAFQGAQRSAETSTATTVSMPELSAQANAFAQQEDPQDYQAHQKQSYMNTFINMFAPAESQRPGMTPVPAA